MNNPPTLPIFCIMCLIAATFSICCDKKPEEIRHTVTLPAITIPEPNINVGLLDVGEDGTLYLWNGFDFEGNINRVSMTRRGEVWEVRCEGGPKPIIIEE